MSSTFDIRLTADTTQLENETGAALRRVARQTRRAIDFTLAAVQAAGAALDTTFMILARTVTLAFEALITIITAQSLLNPTALIQLGQVAILLLQIRAIRQGRTEAAAQLGFAEQALSYLYYNLVCILFGLIEFIGGVF